MSTRATYEFKLEDKSIKWKSNITLYIQTDNYPEGAAKYFNDLKEHNDKEGGRLAESFIRTNPYTEFTRDHYAHYDTEYRYILTEDGMLTAKEHYKRTYDKKGNLINHFRIFFKGNYKDFIKKYLEKQQ